MIRSGLHKSQRLKRRKAIEGLFAGGTSLSAYPFRLYYRLLPVEDEAAAGATDGLQFGVGVGKRHFKRAVDRNRLKRLTREAYRLERAPLLAAIPAGQVLQVFFIYTGRELSGFPLVRAKVAGLLRRLQQEKFPA